MSNTAKATSADRGTANATDSTNATTANATDYVADTTDAANFSNSINLLTYYFYFYCTPPLTHTV